MTTPTPNEDGKATEGTEPDATDTAPENTLPADPAQLQPEIVGVRKGMFGVRGSGDTSGYGGLVRPVVMPGGSSRPYGGWFDEVDSALRSGLAELGLAVPDVVPPGPAVEWPVEVTLLS